MNSTSKKLPWLNLVLALGFISFLIYFSFKYAPGITELTRNTEQFRDLILSYGKKGALIFISFQIIQIIIPIIPGEVVQIAGGYVYGTLIGVIYIIIGTLAGTALAFCAARIIGYPIVKILVKPVKITKFKAVLATRKSESLIFIMMLMPGFPKDALVYIAGLTPIKPIRFMIISILARIPAQIGCVFIGSNIHQKDYTAVIIVVAITVVFIALAFIFRRFVLPVKRLY
ncbi:MAG: VTT domain-containing protein [Syntrophomonas sp.]|nr:VTT domain-containing protein [Syntrophomonas sp.]